jgi:hypothetical protein
MSGDILALFQEISDCLTRDENNTLAERLNILQDTDITDYEGAVTFNKDKHHRILLHRNKWLDAYLLTWMPQQGTSWHGHPDRGCIYKLLVGELVEERTSNTGETPVTSTLLTEGDASYIDNSIGFHRVINQSKRPSVSLHFYAPPGYYECATLPDASDPPASIRADHQKKDGNCQDKDKDKNGGGDKDIGV